MVIRHSEKAARAFRGEGYNFMTPDRLGYFEAGGFAVELSRGTGMDNQPIFGVTVRHFDGSRPARDASKLFQDEGHARNYINLLGNDQ